MPVMDGVAAWIEIKKLGEQTAPIVALTANAMEGDRNKYIEAGMDDYITKPITFEALEVLLAKWLMQVEGKGQIQEKPSAPTSVRKSSRRSDQLRPPRATGPKRQ